MSAEKARNKIIHAAGNLYIADSIATSLEQLRPSSVKHQAMITRMQKELIQIRNAECIIADSVPISIEEV